MSKTEGGEIQTHKPLRTYRYIRGVDGQLVQSQVSEEKKTNEKAEPESKWAYTKNLELPIGRGQLDYVRRLARDMKDDWKDVKLTAIGVVGSDVYDKLILLHALREEFGDVLLFMTDLDARLMHYEQSKWTRDVIVSSNFGFKLNDVYYAGVDRNTPRYVPPFRDNYQTSLFLACRAALGLKVNDNGGSFRYMSADKLAELLNHPRLFEIGRGRAVDISMSNADIHPKVRWVSWRTSLRLAFFIPMALVFCVLLLAQINTQVAKITSSPRDKPVKKARAVLHAGANGKKGAQKKEGKKADPAVWPVITNVSVLVTVVFVVVVIIDHYRLGGEPFSLFSGVSIWPGVTLRLIAAVLSVCFIAKSYQDLRRSDEDLDYSFHLNMIKNFYPTTFADWRKPRDISGRLVSKIRNWASYLRWISVRTWDTGEGKIDAKELWAGYLARGSGWNRFHRFFAMTLTYFGLAIALAMILGIPKTPYRGSVSRDVDVVLLLASVVPMIGLIFLVVDATRLSIKFVRSLKTPETIWPDELVDELREKNAETSSAETGQDGKPIEDTSDRVSDKALSEWLDIKFIASHTQAVGRLIYYPFIVLLIMFLARSPYFDRWGFPISLIAIFLLNSTLAVCCGCMLRREAENTRRLALGRLQEYLVRATGAGHGRSARQLALMIDEIRSMRQGAYSSFTANPVLHAILIPSGGISVLTLLRFISLS